MPGTVVTFYSYKGGVGRSFALANIATILGQWGFRVLAVDWDIEAPGLHHYFAGFDGAPARGVLGFLDDCQSGKTREWHSYASRVMLPAVIGEVFLMPSAAGGGHDYSSRLQFLDWNALYDRHNFGTHLEELRSSWIDQFDFVLIDSRTGLTDFSGILTAQLPDVLAFFFTANNQSFQGCVDIVRRAMEERSKLPIDRPALIPLPILARFEQREEYDRASEWRERFARDLLPLFDIWASRHIDKSKLLDALTIPYVPRWTFGEELCALTETAGRTGTRAPSLAASYALETLAAILANQFNKMDLLTSSRDEYVLTALTSGRSPEQPVVEVFLSAPPFGRTGLAQYLQRALAEYPGIRVYLEETSPEPRVRWDEEIESQLSRADALIIILGDRVYPQQEAEVETFLRQSLRTRKRKPIIPIMEKDGVEALRRSSRLYNYQALLFEPGAFEQNQRNILHILSLLRGTREVPAFEDT